MFRALSRRTTTAALVIGCSIAGAAFAQTTLMEKRTLFTFSGPVAVPGVTLPAGQYLFYLADAGTGRKVVQVLSGDASKVYGMFFTIPNERPQPAPTPEVRFMETAAGMPSAVKTWWYPGERTGYEFIYPKEQASQLTKGGGASPLLTTVGPTRTPEQTREAELARMGPGGVETPVTITSAPLPAAPIGTTVKGEIPSSPVTMPARTPEMMAMAAERRQLPSTGSPLPLIALFGSCSIASAVGVRAWRKRR